MTHEYLPYLILLTVLTVLFAPFVVRELLGRPRTGRKQATRMSVRLDERSSDTDKQDMHTPSGTRSVYTPTNL